METIQQLKQAFVRKPGSFCLHDELASHTRKVMRKFSIAFVLVLIVGFGLYTCIAYYGYVFAKTVRGQFIGVERVNDNLAMITGRQVDPVQMFSFAIAIRSSQGDIYTASSEDRQWAVVQKGQCGEAKFYPYPPWDFERSGTYHGARLIKLYDCPESLQNLNPGSPLPSPKAQ
jgi:hypothetical protein